MSKREFRTADDEPVTVPTRAVEALRESISGGVLEPGDAGYDAARAIWNAMIDRRPALIARCEGTEDVARCLAFGREHGVVLTVRGGGHNIGGRALADGGLVMDFSHRPEVVVDAERRRVSVRPGATLGHVDAATAPLGLVLPTGIVSETGLTGLTMGGGFGWLSRRFGLTADHLIGAEGVTGSGERFESFAPDEGGEVDDLLWALRGGGGAGVVLTRLHFRAHEIGPEMTCGMIVHRGEGAAAVATEFRDRAEAGSEEQTLLLILRQAPPAPFLPESIHGRSIAAIAACHCGEAARADRELGPLRSFGEPVADLVARKPFVGHQQMFDKLQPKGRRYYWKSEYLAELDDEIVEALVEHTRELPSPHAAVLVFQLGGAVSRLPATASSVGHRDARFIVNITGAWERPEDDEENVAWVARTWEAVHERSRGGGYLNFLTADASVEEWGASLGGVDVERLRQIRRHHDPEGLLARSEGPLPVAPR